MYPETVPTIDLRAAAKKIGSLPVKKAAIRGVQAAALRGVSEIVTFIIPSRSPQPVDRGVYRSGWRSEKTPTGATIENLEPHAVFIEHGVKNVKIGAAALAALVEWVVRKGLADTGNALTVARNVAWAMKRRGHIFGREGMGILKELVEGGKLNEYIQEEVKAEIERATKR